MTRNRNDEMMDCLFEVRQAIDLAASIIALNGTETPMSEMDCNQVTTLLDTVRHFAVIGAKQASREGWEARKDINRRYED